MNLESEIMREHSKKQAMKIAGWIGKDSKRFGQLMKLFLHGDRILTQRSAWIISCSVEKYPILVLPWLSRMLKKICEPGVHTAAKRNVVRVLRTAEIPRSLLGPVMTICFDELASPSSPIAVRVHAMAVLVKIAEDKPVITKELNAMIEQMLPHASPGIYACMKNSMKKLSRLDPSINHRFPRQNISKNEVQ